MFGWFRKEKPGGLSISSSLPNNNAISDEISVYKSKIDSIATEIEDAKTIDSVAFGVNFGLPFRLYSATIKREHLKNDSKRFVVIRSRFSNHEEIRIDLESVKDLRDFLLKHFPVEETDIEKPEVSE